ncbi:MAG: helix-turn-helix domain-containing protein [Acidobacteria bacterium]|nr:helix-turn-helix domain-containing protein [Acidobacteriota bacterium]
MARRRTAFDRDLRRNLRDPAFKAEYEREHRRIAATDRVLRDLDARRRRLGLSKAELARRALANEVVVRRLFTATDPNPTFGTLVDVANALGLELRVAGGGDRNRRRSQPTAG